MCPIDLAGERQGNLSSRLVNPVGWHTDSGTHPMDGCPEHRVGPAAIKSAIQGAMQTALGAKGGNDQPGV